jgi:phage shock protein A
MLRWFRKTKKEEDPAEVIDATIMEMENAIRTSIASLNQLAKNYKDMQDRVAQLHYEAHDLGKEALKAVKQGREIEAKQFLSRKADCEEQAKQYLQIAHEIETSMRKLEKQVSKMKVQLDETKSKKAVLMAEYANAKTQKELAQRLQELNIHTDVFEENILQTQIEAGLETNEDPLLKEFEALNSSDSSVENLKKQAEEEEKRQKALLEANRQKQMELLFGKDFTKSPEPKESIKDKEKILEEFFKEEKTNEKKLNINDFFKETPQNAQASIDAFFANTNNPTQKEIQDLDDFFTNDNQLCINIDSFFSENKKKSIVDDFFSKQEQAELDELEKKFASMPTNEPTTTKENPILKDFDSFFKDDKQKKIDDFFKNS